MGMKRHKTVEEFLGDLDTFQAEATRLREILQSTPLEEEIKWDAPAYTHQGKIVVGIGAFKKHFALWFHQGALLKDQAGHLVNASEGKTKALRQWRFESAKDIKVRAIKAYVKEAIALADAGQEIKPTRNRPIDVAQELEAALSQKSADKKAFAALTPGKRREYANYIAEAKRAETKTKRIEKILPMIRAGAGLHDKYRNC